MKHTLLLGLMLSSSAFAAPALDDPWRNISDPNIMDTNFLRVFDTLPLQGRAAGTDHYWSGDYWSLKKGNINYRWFADRPKGFKLDSPSLATARAMTRDQLTELSPTEKFDILNGRFNYPLVQQVGTIANKRADDWEGICHGWAPATIAHSEPTPKDMVSVDGITVPFGSSDIKALISYYYAHGFEVDNTHQMGLRCFKSNDIGGWFSSDKDNSCDEDLNAGAFHLVLTNMIALRGIAFVADLDKSDEVWNHPVWYFQSTVEKEGKPNRKSAPGTVKTVRIKTQIRYTNESLNYWDTIIGTEYQQEDIKKYEYDLDINGYGEIVGGKWKSSDRPDFLWIKPRPAKFEGLFVRLPELLNVK